MSITAPSLVHVSVTDGSRAVHMSECLKPENRTLEDSFETAGLCFITKSTTHQASHAFLKLAM